VTGFSSSLLAAMWPISWHLVLHGQRCQRDRAMHMRPPKYVHLLHRCNCRLFAVLQECVLPQIRGSELVQGRDDSFVLSERLLVMRSASLNTCCRSHQATACTSNAQAYQWLRCTLLARRVRMPCKCCQQMLEALPGSRVQRTMLKYPAHGYCAAAETMARTGALTLAVAHKPAQCPCET